jgi:hypothetical protein
MARFRPVAVSADRVSRVGARGTTSTILELRFGDVLKPPGGNAARIVHEDVEVTQGGERFFERCCTALVCCDIGYDAMCPGTVGRRPLTATFAL